MKIPQQGPSEPCQWVTEAMGAAGVTAWRWNRTTRKVDVSRGDSAGEADPEIWMKAVHPEDLGALREKWVEAVRINSPIKAQFRMADSAKQEPRWVFIHAVPAGEYYTGVAYDIT